MLFNFNIWPKEAIIHIENSMNDLLEKHDLSPLMVKVDVPNGIT